MRRHVVIFGAGSVGRGFIAELFSDAGWEIVFVDVNQKLIDAINKDCSYQHVTVTHAGSNQKKISHVSVLHSAEKEAVVQAILSADALATAVGANVLPLIIPQLAIGLRLRIETGRLPINMFICENLHGAAETIQKWLQEQLPDLPTRILERNIGLIETSIGRMIPVPSPDMILSNPAEIRVEPYKFLPFDAAASRGMIPDNPFFIGDVTVPFSFYGDRKLYVHNMGHCFCAYLAEMLDLSLIWKAIEQAEVRYFVRSAMIEVAMALASRYRQPLEPIVTHIDDLLFRFHNRQLNDTVERVGRDPKRKLARDDRFFGAWRLCFAEDIAAPHLTLALALGVTKLWHAQNNEQTSKEFKEDVQTIQEFAVKLFDERASDVSTCVLRILYERQVSLLQNGFDFIQQIEAIGSLFKLPQVI